MAKWVMRRSNTYKKYIDVCKARHGLLCAAACSTTAIVMFDAVDQRQSSEAHNLVREFNRQNIVAETFHGFSHLNLRQQGLSSTFGCSSSIFMHTGFKIAKSQRARQDASDENHYGVFPTFLPQFQGPCHIKFWIILQLIPNT